MPVLGITTPIEFVEEEWAKLARAWRAMHPTDRDYVLQAKLDAMRASGRLRLFPDIPDWDEILRLGRVPIHLTPAEIAARRRRIIARIRRTPAPPVAQATASVINAIDDVQDLASFAGLALRLILRAAPRVAVRAVPLLGWAATASDVLNLLSFLTLTAGAAVAIRTEGPLAGAAQLGGTVIARQALKNELWSLLRRNRHARVRPAALSDTLRRLYASDAKLPPAAAARAARLLGKRVALTEVIESAQALETLTGYGLSLGALMGYLTDLSWGLYHGLARAAHAGAQTLKRALTDAPPHEWIIGSRQGDPDWRTFREPWSVGPAHLWRTQRRDLPTPPDVLQTTHEAPATVPAPYCWVVLDIHHPAYPREPDSVHSYSHFPVGRWSATYRQALADFGQRGYILQVRPTVDGY